MIIQKRPKKLKGLFSDGPAPRGVVLDYAKSNTTLCIRQRRSAAKHAKTFVWDKQQGLVSGQYGKRIISTPYKKEC